MSYRVISVDATRTPVRIGLLFSQTIVCERLKLRSTAHAQRDRISVDSIARATRCAPWERC